MEIGVVAGVDANLDVSFETEDLRIRLLRDKIEMSDEGSQTNSLKGRVYPISSTGYANLFFAESQEEQAKLIQDLELVFTRVLTKLRIPRVTSDNQVKFNGFFSDVETLIQTYDPGAKVYLGGGSIRSIISFVYQELVEARSQGLDPQEVLEGFGNGTRKFSVENDLGEISPMHVLGVESDIDIYIEFSENNQKMHEAIAAAKQMINRGLEVVNDSPLKALIFPPADVKPYDLQMQRAQSNGGSALDWLVFPLTNLSGSHFKTPPNCPHVLEFLCKGKLPYFSVTNAEVPAITTLRVYRSLFELPFLEIEETATERFVEDLKNVQESLQQYDIRSRVSQVFQKVLKNVRFPDRVNLELKDSNPLNTTKRDLLNNISKAVKQNKNLPALPELLPSIVDPTKLDYDLLNQFELNKLFVDEQSFINNHTSGGVLYHGTPDIRNMIPMIRGALVVSNQFQGSAGCGRGFYSTKDESVAKSYACSGIVIPFKVQVGNLRIVNLSAIPEDLKTLLEQKAQVKGIDINEYLGTHLGVDIILNDYVLIQNSRALKFSNTYEQFLIDSLSRNFERACKYFEDLDYESLSTGQTGSQMSHLNSFDVLVGLVPSDEVMLLINKYNQVKSKVLDWVFNRINRHSDYAILNFTGSSLNWIDDRDFVLSCVKNVENTFQWLKARFKDDKEVILAALEKDPWALEYASDRLRDDKEVVLMAIENDPWTLEYASYRLRDDKEVVLMALENDGWALEYASDRLRDDKEVVLIAIENGGWGLQYASDRLRDDKEVVLMAIENDPWALECTSERLRDDKEVVLAAVENNPWAFQYASDRLRDDKELVLMAIENDPGALHRASNRLKDDKDVVLAAVRNNGWLLQCASDRLKDDKDVVLAAVSHNGWALQFATDRLRDDKEVVLAAVRKDSRVLQYASDRLKMDSAVIEESTK